MSNSRGRGKTYAQPQHTQALNEQFIADALQYQHNRMNHGRTLVALYGKNKNGDTFAEWCAAQGIETPKPGDIDFWPNVAKWQKA